MDADERQWKTLYVIQVHGSSPVALTDFFTPSGPIAAVVFVLNPIRGGEFVQNKKEAGAATGRAKEKHGICVEGAVASLVDRRRLCATVGAAESIERSDSETNPGAPSRHRRLVDGQFGWLHQSGDLLIATDLDLDANNKSDPKIHPPPLTPQQLAGELDVEFVTHQHGDHCNIPTIQGLAQGSRTIFVLPQSCLKQVASLNIPKQRIIVPEPLHPFDVKGIHVRADPCDSRQQDFTVLTREPDLSTTSRTTAVMCSMSGASRFSSRAIPCSPKST